MTHDVHACVKNGVQGDMHERCSRGTCEITAADFRGNNLAPKKKSMPSFQRRRERPVARLNATFEYRSSSSFVGLVSTFSTEICSSRFANATRQTHGTRRRSEEEHVLRLDQDQNLSRRNEAGIASPKKVEMSQLKIHATWTRMYNL